MFSFPVNAVSDLVRNNIEAQLSLFSTMSARLFNTSLRLGELNAEAGRRLMEESAAAMEKGMRLRTLADTQSFLMEQSQATVEKMRGYQQNVQNIAAENWIPFDKDADAHKDADAPAPVSASEPAAQPENAADGKEQKEVASPGQHETDHRPSALVEKLIASAVGDKDSARE